MKNNNIPAFPVAMSEQTFVNQDSSPYQEGMTLRDYFAAKAVNGVLGCDNWKDLGMTLTNGINISENIAKYSYELADAMLKQREL